MFKKWKERIKEEGFQEGYKYGFNKGRDCGLEEGKKLGYYDGIFASESGGVHINQYGATIFKDGRFEQGIVGDF